MTRIEAMTQAVKEANEFCNKYTIAPYGNSFSDFRQKATEMFFNEIYYHNDNKVCKDCKFYENCEVEDKALKSLPTEVYKKFSCGLWEEDTYDR